MFDHPTSIGWERAKQAGWELRCSSRTAPNRNLFESSVEKSCRLGHSLLHPLVGLFGDSLLESPFEGDDRGCNDIGVDRDARLRGSGIFEFWAQEDPQGPPNRTRNFKNFRFPCVSS